jgi:hypothetical protein
MTINLKVEEHIYKFFPFLKFFCIYLEIHCQDCQNNPLSMDPTQTIITIFLINISRKTIFWIVITLRAS